MHAIGQLLPHEGGVAAGRRLARIEQRRARAPHHRRRDGAGLVVAHDVAELVDVVEPHDHHEGLRQLGVLGARAVARRLAQIEIEREQRRQQIVLEALRAVADVARQQRVVEQVEKGLVRIERRRDEDAGRGSPRPRRSRSRRRGRLRPGCASGSVISLISPPLRAPPLRARAPAPPSRRATSAPWPGSPAAPRCDGRSRGSRRSTSRSPLKNRSPALTVGCSNSCSTNCSGESALTSSSRRPALAASEQRAALLRRQRRRAALRRQNVCARSARTRRASGASVSASRRLKRANDAIVSFDVGPPFERAAVAGEQRDVELGLD